MKVITEKATKVPQPVHDGVCVMHVYRVGEKGKRETQFYLCRGNRQADILIKALINKSGFNSYNFIGMEVGDSFFISNNGTKKTCVSTATSYYNKNYKPKKWTSKTVDGGWTVLRIA